MGLNAYLSFNGQCEEAFSLYEACLGGKILYKMTFAEMPGHDIASEWSQKIAHATLKVGNDTLQGADSPPEQYQKPQGFGMAISLKDSTEADRIFKALSENGTV